MRRAPGDPPPAPGAPPAAAPGFVHGRFAKVTALGITLNCFDWEVEVTEEHADGTAHGDYYNVPVPIRTDWTGRARGYFALAGTATDTYINGGFTTTTPVSGTFIGYRDSASAVPLFTGTCLVTRARLSAPNAMMEQEIEVRGDGVAPSAGV